MAPTGGGQVSSSEDILLFPPLIGEAKITSKNKAFTLWNVMAEKDTEERSMSANNDIVKPLLNLILVQRVSLFRSLSSK